MLCRIRTLCFMYTVSFRPVRSVVFHLHIIKKKILEVESLGQKRPAEMVKPDFQALKLLNCSRETLGLGFSIQFCKRIPFKISNQVVRPLILSGAKKKIPTSQGRPLPCEPTAQAGQPPGTQQRGRRSSLRGAVARLSLMVTHVRDGAGGRWRRPWRWPCVQMRPPSCGAALCGSCIRAPTCSRTAAAKLGPAAWRCSMASTCWRRSWARTTSAPGSCSERCGGAGPGSDEGCAGLLRLLSVGAALNWGRGKKTPLEGSAYARVWGLFGGGRCAPRGRWDPLSRTRRIEDRGVGGGVGGGSLRQPSRRTGRAGGGVGWGDP